MLQKDEVEKLLRRSFKSGLLRRLPRKREDADVIMALSIAGMDPDGIFDESQMNVHLSAWLDGIADQQGNLDHVTLRRYLVDYDFLRRASDGVIYRIRPERIDEVLATEAKTIDAKALFEEEQTLRSVRRAAFSRK